MTAALIADLKARGLINQVTADEELITHLESGSRTLQNQVYRAKMPLLV